MDKARLKKIGKIAGNAILYLFLALCIIVVGFTVFGARNEDGAVNVFGYQMRIVTTDSMAPCEATDVSGYEIGSIRRRSVVFVETVPEDPAEAAAFYESLREYDVLTFRYVYTSQVTITHRLIHKEPNGKGGYILTLVGDNKTEGSHLLTQTIDTSEKNAMNYVIGKVVGTSYLLGTVLSVLREPVGIVCVIILPCLVIIVLEVLKIIGVMNAEKKKKAQAEKEATENELAELRKRLAEYERRDTADKKNGTSEEKKEDEN
jgi:hypothetical protein